LWLKISATTKAGLRKFSSRLTRKTATKRQSFSERDTVFSGKTLTSTLPVCKSLTTSSDSMKSEVRLSKVVLPAFRDFWKATKSDRYLYYVLKGGRSSGKSAQISINRLVATMKYPINGLVVRRYGIYLRDSVFEQFKW